MAFCQPSLAGWPNLVPSASGSRATNLSSRSTIAASQSFRYFWLCSSTTNRAGLSAISSRYNTRPSRSTGTTAKDFRRWLPNPVTMSETWSFPVRSACCSASNNGRRGRAVPGGRVVFSKTCPVGSSTTSQESGNSSNDALARCQKSGQSPSSNDLEWASVVATAMCLSISWSTAAASDPALLRSAASVASRSVAATRALT